MRSGLARCWVLGLALVAGAGARSAHAERPLRGSLGAGGALVLTGAGGDHLRLDMAVDLKPWSRYGLLLAWRAFDRDHHGLVTAGVVYEAAAARPRLVLDLHASAGADLDRAAPLVGGGVRATLGLLGPLGLALDSGAYLVVEGISDPALQLQSSARLVITW